MSLEIPYTTDTRPDTGLTNARLGIWLFLASEVMLFASLFSSYALLRTGADTWPDQSAVLSMPLGAVNTALLLLSSLVIGQACGAIRDGNSERYRQWMALCVALGVAFLAIKGYEWADKLDAGLVPSTSNFLGLYFTLTGLHAAHLFAGVVVNGSLLLAAAGSRGPHGSIRLSQRAQIARLYWNFVDAVWIVIFVVFYLL
jgi:heme/copper-type cytochrome/quinol oxidase subunit 3